MSEENQSVKNGWTSVQVYGLSVVCLLVGVALGFLFRGSSAKHGDTAAAPQAIQQSQQAAGPQAGGMPADTQQPSPEQLKQMADKKVAPLLDELKKDPKNTDTLTKVGSFYLMARQFDQAQEYFQKVVDVKPTAESLTQLASAQYYGGSGDKAIDSLNKALQINPKYANALFNLGMLKWKVKGDVKGAIDSWETLVKTNPNHPQIDQVKKMIAQAKEHEKIPLGTKTDKPAM